MQKIEMNFRTDMTMIEQAYFNASGDDGRAAIAAGDLEILEMGLEASAVQHLSRNFDVGLVGYYYRQISDDWGSGARLGGFRGEVIALGGTAGVTFNVAEREVMTRVKVYREFNVSNRLQGTAAFFTVALPLTKPMAPPPPPN